MKIVPYDEHNWKKDHPTGAIAFQHMLKGDPGTADNFMYILGRQDGDFAMPPHRHNFDQIRLPLRGAMNHGRGIVVEEGQVGYFPEGLAYGPQDDPLREAKPGERMQLVLQFRGASNYGFMSIEERREAWAELGRQGSFDGPFYIRPDGKREWGLNTVWKMVFGTKIRYPRARYTGPIIADPKCFHWLHLEGVPGVEHKYMGAFSERAVWIEMIKMRPNAVWSSQDSRARRLFVVLNGTGTIGERSINYLTAVQADPHELLELRAKEELTLFLIGLPPVELPAVESEEYDFEEMPNKHSSPEEAAQ